jgi:predicted nucleic acid-binding protein
VPVADTEVLFSLNPKDPKHARVMRLLCGPSVVVPDVVLFEFQLVLRAKGLRPGEVRTAMLAVREALKRCRVKEVKTLDTKTLALQCELEEKYGLSYFDSLIAASALVLDRKVISSDKAFDRVPELVRIPLG